MPHIDRSRPHPRSCCCPESLDDYVGDKNPVRFIEAFVDGLDLTAAGFRPGRWDRPARSTLPLLKLYIYGYLNRVRSSRRLEAETHRNIEVIWLLRHSEADGQDHRRFPARQPQRVHARSSASS